MSQVPISDYGFLSDCRSAALVSRGGSVDWWCPDRFDGPSVFGRLLDPQAGYWSLAPTEESETQAESASGPGPYVERSYLPDTLVLRTVHHTGSGSVAVTEALAVEPGARGHELGRASPAVLVRVVEGLTGTVRMRVDFVPRPEYGLLTPYLHRQPDRVVAAAGPTTVTLRAPVPLTCQPGRVYGEFEVTAGQVLGFDVAYAPAYDTVAPAELDPVATIPDTVEAWRAIRETHRYQGLYPELVRHSALVLQGLTYQRSGAVVAAATTSLPEQLAADRNYDYRYAWLRDFAFTMNALWVGACPEETSRLFGWAARSAGRIGASPVPIMYGVEGERHLAENVMGNLRGYAESRPVRTGNDAWRQRQLDVLGEVLEAAYRMRDQLHEFDEELRELLVGLADQAAATWREADAGMWEARDQERHYLSSKVMCWVALERAVRLAPLLGERADPERWAAVRDEIRLAVLHSGWNDEVHAYTGAFGSPELDASVLILPLVHFLPATDPRMRATIHAIESRLTVNGLVRRWSGDPAGFVLCTFWLVECLALAGEYHRAVELFDRTVAHANDVGLFAEQLAPDGAHLGNTPQALSHIGLINAAWRLTESVPSR
ncbi:glycoside hydrolase family 15 protein [Micromonospora polyrhachis]|uniref:glycoside hydrolase family 15 protein n=1 Tax=Micromonospora polyrhachis TaxID=1282883 RepID=UPI0016180FF2|nr:glycoside hydrolase family 15 protein [Micromonospora polyrhachis]